MPTRKNTTPNNPTVMAMGPSPATLIEAPNKMHTKPVMRKFSRLSRVI